MSSGTYLVMREYLLDNWPALVFIVYAASLLTAAFYAWLEGADEPIE